MGFLDLYELGENGDFFDRWELFSCIGGYSVLCFPKKSELSYAVARIWSKFTFSGKKGDIGMKHSNKGNLLDRDETKDQRDNLQDAAFKLYTLRMGESLFNKIDRHVTLTNHMIKEKKKRSKQIWVIEAIREKLEREKVPISHIPKQKSLHFKIPEDLSRVIEARVKLIQEVRGSFSRKLWFIEAIYEKLEKEDQMIQEMIKEMETCMHPDI